MMEYYSPARFSTITRISDNEGIFDRERELYISEGFLSSKLFLPINACLNNI
jgi:hypothetical protein